MYSLEMKKIEDFLLLNNHAKDSNGYYIFDTHMICVSLSTAFISNGFKTNSTSNYDEFIKIYTRLR